LKKARGFFMTEAESCVAFNLTAKIGSVGADMMRDSFGSYSAAWENYPDKVSRYNDDLVNVEREYELAEKLGVKIVTMVDEEYPSQLRNIKGRPLALYVKGSVSALTEKFVAVVGTRRASQYGKEQAERFAYDLSKNGFGIVSGLAIGIDAAAHEGTLEAKGVTVGVLGGAIDKFYPEKNKDLARRIIDNGGAVISQFPFGRHPDTTTFPMRNSVVAGLSEGILAVECPERSGTMITVGKGLDMGKVIMAIPGRVDSHFSAGCLSLIRDGAVLVRSSKDVMEALGTGIKLSQEDIAESSGQVESKLPPVTLEESIVMRHIFEEPISIDELAKRTGLALQRVNSLCMMLRMKERIKFLPGNRVAIPGEV
jgi:DNA processing protein